MFTRTAGGRGHSLENKKEWLSCNAAGSMRRPILSTTHPPVTTQAPRARRRSECSRGVRACKTEHHNTCSKDGERRAGGMNKQRRTTGLPDFAAETTFGKDGAKTVHAITHFCGCNMTRLNTGVRDDDEYVAVSQERDEVTCSSCGTDGALCAETSAGTCDRAQQCMTWIWPYSQKHHSAKERSRRSGSNSQMSKDECIAGMGTGAGRSVHYSTERLEPDTARMRLASRREEVCAEFPV